MKITTMLAAIVLCASVDALAQEVQISHLDRLADRAEEVVNVDITPSMLGFISSWIPANDPDAAAVKLLVAGLKAIRVRVFDFGRENVYTPDDISTIRKQLTGPRWAKMVTVDSKRDKEIVDVYFWMENDKVGGLFVLVAEATQLTVVNIVGPIDPSKLPALQKIGVPALPEIEAPTKKP